CARAIGGWDHDAFDFW
nr:immunoglobulin heavy chain junction region [Macaca mulatta]MOV49202.1 immunoglobulin heavy chain junction region [Macaca mulatta]MOV50865.1 immunoglobulin heavy chain junction region [Macaca mulatta]MOV52586.1 immunoglobulin heavy chain junction region [Macaca mulatta]